MRTTKMNHIALGALCGLLMIASACSGEDDDSSKSPAEDAGFSVNSDAASFCEGFATTEIVGLADALPKVGDGAGVTDADTEAVAQGVESLRAAANADGVPDELSSAALSTADAIEAYIATPRDRAVVKKVFVALEALDIQSRKECSL